MRRQRRLALALSDGIERMNRNRGVAEDAKRLGVEDFDLAFFDRAIVQQPRENLLQV